MKYLFENDDLVSAGQPEISYIDELVNAGHKVIINMRSTNEADFTSYKQAVESRGLSYYHLPFFDGDEINVKSLDSVAKLFKVIDVKPFVHCKTANRIGAWYYYYLVKYKNMDRKSSHEQATKMGLTKDALIEKINAYL